MGVRTTGSEPAVVLYDSVSGYPLATEVFSTEEEAEAFLNYAEGEQDLDLRRLPPRDLAELRRRFHESRGFGELIRQLRDYANADHDDSPLATDLRGYAAGAALSVLIDNWSDAGERVLTDMIPDVDQVALQLQHFRTALNALLLQRGLQQLGVEQHEERVPYANSFADTAAGAGSN